MAELHLEKPLRLHDFRAGDVLLQYVRNPSAVDPHAGAGSWFSPRGVALSGSTVPVDLSGRRPVAFKVAVPFFALEGTVGALDKGKIPRVGGVGGQTQVFVPQSLRARLAPLG
jgi:hypothetical protein